MLIGRVEWPVLFNRVKSANSGDLDSAAVYPFFYRECYSRIFATTATNVAMYPKIVIRTIQDQFLQRFVQQGGHLLSLRNVKKAETTPLPPKRDDSERRSKPVRDKDHTMADASLPNASSTTSESHHQQANTAEDTIMVDDTTINGRSDAMH